MAQFNIDNRRACAPPDIRAQFTRVAPSLGCALLLFLAGAALAADEQSPENVYANRPNNLEKLPAGWSADSPIELVVSFNLESAPNSKEAQLFLNTWYESISSLPYDVDLTIKRIVAPDDFTYAVSLVFNNWAEYREYERSEDFLAYYYAHWKPRVHEAQERVFILEKPAAMTESGVTATNPVQAF